MVSIQHLPCDDLPTPPRRILKDDDDIELVFHQYITSNCISAQNQCANALFHPETVFMSSPITVENWPKIRSNFRHGFATNLHVAVATADADGQPQVTPIGSFFLHRDGFSGFYFEIFTSNIPRNAATNPKVCIMAVNSGRWYWLKSLVLGKFATPPMTKIYGRLGERRPATPAEIERGNRRLGRMKTLPGGKKLFGNMGFVRELHFHAFEEAKLNI